jgi:hypothetical protein
LADPSSPIAVSPIAVSPIAVSPIAVSPIAVSPIAFSFFQQSPIALFPDHPDRTYLEKENIAPLITPHIHPEHISQALAHFLPKKIPHV